MPPEPHTPLFRSFARSSERRRVQRRSIGGPPVRGAAALAAALTLLVPNLSACSGDASADASSPGVDKAAIDRIVSAAAVASASSAAASRSASAPSTATTSATGTSTTDFVLPAAAKAHTQEGAKAFVRFYWDVLDRLDMHPQNGIIERFSVTTCESCRMQIDTIAAMVRDGVHVETSNTKIGPPTVRSDSTSDSVIVTFTQTDDGSVRVVPSGSKSTVPPTNLFVAARADWTGTEWKLGDSGADKK